MNSQDIIKTAFDNGINMFDVAESYAEGKSESELYVSPPLPRSMVLIFPARV